MSIFNDTKIAFAEKSTAQLEKKSQVDVYRYKYPSLTTNVGINVLNFTIKNNFPLVTDLVKTTLFEQFCGGETREQSMKVVDKMFKHHVGSILIMPSKEKKKKRLLIQLAKKLKKT